MRSTLKNFLHIAIVVLGTLAVVCPWKTGLRPRVYGDSLPRTVLLPSRHQVQRKIVAHHNHFRSHVTPPAADMLAMTWHRGAALAAQTWADRCLLLTHDSPSGRWLNVFGSCGQNIFISTHRVPWIFAIKTWFLEKNVFTYGSSNNSLLEVGHYTQLVWASSHKVGCGYSECRRAGGHKYHSYVCNYCPIGNHMEKLGLPYTEGKQCSSCPKHCRRQRLCTNSCAAADLWANCQELHKAWPHWLCLSPSRQGRERRRNCRATCGCPGKIK